MVENDLQKAKLPLNIMVDCSHANSNKNPSLQPLVLKDVAHQIKEGNQSITGVMLESNLKSGSQSIPSDIKKLEYGVSVTDGCIDWKTTEKALRELAHEISPMLKKRIS
jgi:3-deoxy-7-phosphoheptulonate synthase